MAKEMDTNLQISVNLLEDTKVDLHQKIKCMEAGDQRTSQMINDMCKIMELEQDIIRNEEEAEAKREEAERKHKLEIKKRKIEEQRLEAEKENNKNDLKAKIGIGIASVVATTGAYRYAVNYESVNDYLSNAGRSAAKNFYDLGNSIKKLFKF